MALESDVPSAKPRLKKEPLRCSLQLAFADGMRSPPGKTGELEAHLRASQMSRPSDQSPCLTEVGVEGGEKHRTGNRHTFLKVAWISPDSSMAPFINVHSAPGSVVSGRRLRLVLEVGGGGFCPILSKLLIRP